MNLHNGATSSRPSGHTERHISIADAILAVEFLAPGLPISQHLGVGAQELFGKFQDLLDRADWSSITGVTWDSRASKVSRLIISRLSCVPMMLLNHLPNFTNIDPGSTHTTLGKRQIFFLTPCFWKLTIRIKMQKLKLVLAGRYKKLSMMAFQKKDEQTVDM